MMGMMGTRGMIGTGLRNTNTRHTAREQRRDHGTRHPKRTGSGTGTNRRATTEGGETTTVTGAFPSTLLTRKTHAITAGTAPGTTGRDRPRVWRAIPATTAGSLKPPRVVETPAAPRRARPL